MSTEICSNSPGDSLGDWASGLEKGNLPGLSQAVVADLNKSMYERYQKLDEIGLLPKSVTLVDCQSFLRDPERYLAQVPSTDLWPVIEPRNHGSELPRFTGAVKAKDVVAQVESTTLTHSAKNFTLVLQPSHDVVMNGSFIIRSDGEIRGEFSGPEASPSRQNARILFTMGNDPYTGVFRYSTDDEGMREAAYSALRHIPSEGEGRERRYLKGYYEFCLVRANGGLTSVFYDYRDNPFFTGE